MFPLLTGDPDNPETPASSTRFVLPFAYRLDFLSAPKRPDPDAPVFQQIAELDDLAWRKRYLTAETAKVLFERARWFRLQGMPKALERFPVVLRDGRGEVEVALKAPLLVLFEFQAKPDGESDFLQTGFLILDLYFPGNPQPEFSDLLEINELFRYWREPFAGHRQEMAEGKPGSGYQRLLQHWPFKDGSTLGKADKPADHIYTGRWTELLTHRLAAGNQSFKLLIDGVNDHTQPNTKDFTVHADDRAYVWTCALLKVGGAALRDAFHPNTPIKATDYGHWIKLLNVDKPEKTPEESHESRAFEQEWAGPLTYRRWEELGTFYGFTPHSGAMLSGYVPEPPLWRHFRRMYFDQALLLLYVRTSLFRFSERLTEISASARDAKDKQQKEVWLTDFGRLREDFVWFTNLYQFPLLSNQQQALEMYAIARKSMDIDALLGEVEKEIQSSHDCLSLQTQQRQTEMGTLLTVVATLGAIAALAGTYLGLDGIKCMVKSIGPMGIVVVFVICFGYVFVSVRIAKWVRGCLENLYNGQWLCHLKR